MNAMLDGNIMGTFPVIEENPMQEAMESNAKLMEQSILQNFLEGGRPQWPYRKVGPFQTPVISNLGGLGGRIASKVTSRFTADTAQAGIFDADEIDWIHQIGGTIHHPGVGYMSGFNTPKVKGEKSKKSLQSGGGKLQVFVIGGVTVFTMRTRPHDIKEPARPYVVFQPEDEEKIKSNTTNVIMRNVKYEPIS